MSLRFILISVFFIILVCCNIFSQFSGTINVGTSQAYTNLTSNSGLFRDINSQGLSGDLTINITSDLSENGANSLNQWAGTYKITIQPSSAVIKNITGSNNTTLIDLNGADRVKIDGRFNGSGQYLRIVNQSAQGTTIRFLNDATLDTITYCIIEGTSTQTTIGTILFSTTNGTNGNDNNVISFCDIRDYTTIPGSTPVNAIYSDGSTTTAAQYNSNISILNNNIYNFYRNGQNCSGILLTGGSTDWTISGNSFYQTSARNVTNATGFNIIVINTANANNITVSGNYIGGRAANCGGGAWNFTGNTSNYIYPIRFVSAGTTTASNVDGNIIANINFSSNPANSGTIYFAGILLENGLINVGTTSGNTIGNNSSNGNIVLTFTGTTTNIVCRGIDHRRTGSINNNVVGSVNIGGSNTGLIRFDAISQDGSPSTAFTVSGNTIGSTTVPGSIQNTTNIIFQLTGIRLRTLTSVNATVNSNTVANLLNTATDSNSFTHGIFQNTGTAGRMTINNNTIAELSGAASSTTRYPDACNVIGIVTGSSYNAQVISGNIIYGLRGTGNTNSFVEGFSPYNNNGQGTFSQNKIYDLTHTSTTGAAKVYGINIFWGIWHVYNNQISITN